MRKILNISLVFLLSAVCLSCERDEVYTNRMWLDDLVSYAGIEKGIDLQRSLEDYGIIDGGYDEDENLKREFMAYTLSNLLGENNSGSQVNISDIDDSIYREDILNFMSYSYFEIEGDRFYPLRKMSREEAIVILKKCVSHINSLVFENVENISYRKEIVYDESLMKSDKAFFDGQKLYEYTDGKYAEANIMDILEFAYISGETAVDFDSAYIEEIHQTYQNSSAYDDEFTRQASLSSSRSFEINGYKVSYSAAVNRLHLHVSKKSDKGINFYFDSDIYDIRPAYKWNFSDSKINESYLRIAFQTSEELGMSVGRYQYLYGDFKNIDKQNLFESLKGFLKEKKDIVDTSFSICRIHIPLGNIPTLELVIELKVNIYVSGRVEIVLDSSHNLGFEYRNGVFRIINENSRDVDLNIEASSSCKTDIDLSLEALGTKLMNVDAEAGVKAKIDTIVHMYDDDLVTSEKSSADYDFLKDILDGSSQVFACGDLSLYWIGNLTFNESDTMAYKLGLYKKINILDEDNQIFGNLHHIENGMFVEKCTRKGAVSIKKDDVTVNPDRIVLDSYSMVIKSKEASIEIKTLPDGYSASDIRYESENSEVLKVSSNGIITAIKPGVSKIRVYTSDNKYESYINCLVSDAAF